MKARGKLATAICIACATLALVVAVSVGWSCISHQLTITKTADAVQVIAFVVADMYASGEDPTDADIQKKLCPWVEYSVISADIDSQGRTVDLFGTPFQIHLENVANQHITIVTSAGPDRQFDTLDDIQHVEKTKLRSGETQ